MSCNTVGITLQPPPTSSPPTQTHPDTIYAGPHCHLWPLVTSTKSTAEVVAIVSLKMVHPSQWMKVVKCLIALHQCCQHLLTRNPKKHEENPKKCIGFMGNNRMPEDPNILYLHMLIRQVLSSKILILGQNPSFWQHCFCVDTPQQKWSVDSTLHGPYLMAKIT